MTKVVHDTDVGTGLEIAGGKLGVAGSMATDAEVAAAIAAAFGVGSSIAISRSMPASTGGTMLSSTTTGLLEFEGMLLDIKWYSTTYGEPWLINTTSAPINIAHSNTLDFGNVGQQVVTIAAGAGIALSTYASIPWTASSFRLFKANIIVANSKWYVIEIIALPLGTGRNIFMTVTRKL